MYLESEEIDKDLVAKAILFFEKQLDITRKTNDRRGEGGALNNLGEAYRLLGDAQKAIHYYEQSLMIKREIGDRRGEGNTIGNIGSTHLQLGNISLAIDQYEKALVIKREMGDTLSVAMFSSNLAIAFAKDNQMEKAISLL